MLSKIKSIFSILQKVIAIYGMVVAIVEIDSEDFKGSEKEEKALEWLQSRFDEAVESGVIPQWAADMFLNERLAKWIISVLVSVAHKTGFFEREGESS